MQDWLGWNSEVSIVLSSNFLEETGWEVLNCGEFALVKSSNLNDFSRALVTTGY